MESNHHQIKDTEQTLKFSTNVKRGEDNKDWHSLKYPVIRFKCLFNQQLISKFFVFFAKVIIDKSFLRKTTLVRIVYTL